jgi:NAD-dependent deacetylase sirtuin 3
MNRFRSSWKALFSPALRQYCVELRQIHGFSGGLDCCNSSASDIAQQILRRGSKVLVMAGAGVSTPSGIPDFRSPGTGIYDNVRQFSLPYPEALFDIDFFRHTPKPFNAWAKRFFPGVNYRPNVAHFFIKLLHDKEKLLRLYTQNIDGLELLTGLPADKIVFAHGSFSSAACIKCGEAKDVESVKRDILNDAVPTCQKCSGFVKPDIVFFGEMLPERFQLFREDALSSDFLICMGTSLEVYPFAGVAEAVPHNVPRLLLNRNLVGSFGSRGEDCALLGDLVDNITVLADKLGWAAELQELCKTGNAATNVAGPIGA